MPDFTSIISGEGERDVFNNLYIVLAILVSSGLALYGYQAGDLGLFAAGIVFVPLIILGDYASEGRLRKSPATFGVASLAFWTGRLLILLPGIIRDIQFSFFTTPGQGYLSSALAETTAEVQTIVNIFLAPIVENLAIIGVGSLIYLLALRSEFNKTLSLIFAVIPTSIAFAALHGGVNLTFALMAFGIMSFMIIILLGVDSNYFQVPVVPITFGFTVGLHSGLNIGSSGGLLNYYGTLAGATTPVLYASLAIIVFEALTIIGIATGIDDIRKLI